MGVMTNPLLTDSPLPEFPAIAASHVEPAIRQLLEGNRRALAALLTDGAEGWDGLVAPIERMHHRLARAWSPVGHLNGVMNGDDLRVAYNACLPLLTAYHTELGQNAELCAAYQRVLDRDGASLDAAQRKLLENALRDFRLAGVSLPADRKQRFGQVMERLATVQAKFDENVLDATNAWSRHVADEAELAGLPANTVHRARQAAEAAGQAGWLLSLDAPNYQAVLTHAQSETLRREFYEAWVTRASDQGPHAGQWDNSPLMAEILALRSEAANLVGFSNFAEYSIATKMAHRTDEVLDFLRELARVSRPAAAREFAELEQFAGRSLEAWDVAFYAERLKHARLDVSEEALRPYFPLPRVLAGLLAVVTRLYGIRIVARPDALVYHEDVRYFDIVDRDGTPRGGFFLDLYARPKKRGGAWMDECVGRIRMADASALPVAYLVCNFSPPVGSQPSLLTHQEVLTLFHEFGHGLHHMLTRVDYPSVAGINGVPWDAVELPSQFMENFAWRDEVLPLISAHVETGEPLPAEMLRKLQGTRTFQAGMHTARQLEFALFDFRLHAEYLPGSPLRVAETLAEVRDEVAVVRPPAFNRFPNSFQHVFSGGYAAGYYSYKWAEVLSADAFGAFEEHGVFDLATARRFLTSILERGGSRDAMEAFVEFRGRKPQIEPLLRQLGLAA
jgi:oligopeptidase A